MTPLETLMIVFIVVTAVAVVIQMGILIAMYAAVKKSSARMEALAQQVQTRAVPTLDLAQSMLQEYRPKLDAILTNATDISTMVKDEVSRLDGSVGEIMERTRQQVTRVDDLMTRTLDRVENATELVHHSVAGPVRQASGVLQGLTAGLAILFGKGRFGGRTPERSRAARAHKDEMFI